jgi:hypothetical protein
MPFEELKKELTGKYLVIARGISDPDLSAVYLFDAKDEDRVKKILAEERTYVEKKKKNHSLPRLFKKSGVSFDSVSVHNDTMVIWNKPEEEEEDEKPKRGVKVGGVGPKYHKKQMATTSSGVDSVEDGYDVTWYPKMKHPKIAFNDAFNAAMREIHVANGRVVEGAHIIEGAHPAIRRGRKRRRA